VKEITVIGGGIAGLVTGISLRQRGVPATVIEASDYPRHKVCGEFLNGAGLQYLPALGIAPAQHGITVDSVRFCRKSVSSEPASLPDPGIAIPRFILDKALAEKFTALGGKLHCRTRCDVRRAPPGQVRATGRKLRAPSTWKWYGIKAHARNVQPRADVELHFLENGYVGLCRLDNHKTNVCGLFRKPADAHQKTPGLLEHFTGSASLRELLSGADWDEKSLSTISGLSFPEWISEGFSIGDSLSMIPPFTGNGMSVAIETGVLGANSLAEYARGQRSWDEALLEYQHQAESLLRRRFQAANLSQKLLLNPACQSLLILAARHTRLWKNVFDLTR